MSARTDRITKLSALIAQTTAANQPNKATAFTAKLATFEAMSDADYDYLMALNTATLANPALNSQDFHRSYYTRKEG